MDGDGPSTSGPVAPREVKYCQITGTRRGIGSRCTAFVIRGSERGAPGCLFFRSSAHMQVSANRPGVPPEFNDFLPKDSDEHKKLKMAQEAAAEAGIEGLSLESLPTQELPPKQMPGNKGKKKKSSKSEVVLERNTRNKKKCVTTISGLDQFGVKLSEASKLFGKKFASGASIVKNAEGKEQIDVQVC